MFIWTNIKGDFICDHCDSLKSLKGAPKEIGGNFTCNNCKDVFTKTDIKKIFTIDDIKKVSNVKGKIFILENYNIEKYDRRR